MTSSMMDVRGAGEVNPNQIFDTRKNGIKMMRGRLLKEGKGEACNELFIKMRIDIEGNRIGR